MYGFSIITNDYGFLYEFAFYTGGYIKVLEVPNDIGLCDRFELCYPELLRMKEAQEALGEILLK